MLALDSAGNIVVGGDFTSVNGVAVARVARLAGGPQMVLPRFTIIRAGGGSVNLGMMTTAGLAYTLERRSGVASGAWTTVLQFTGDGTVKSVTDDLDGSANRFYRVRVRE